jgi:hypothetical protein
VVAVPPRVRDHAADRGRERLADFATYEDYNRLFESVNANPFLLFALNLLIFRTFTTAAGRLL